MANAQCAFHWYLIIIMLYKWLADWEWARKKINIFCKLKCHAEYWNFHTAINSHFVFLLISSILCMCIYSDKYLVGFSEWMIVANKKKPFLSSGMRWWLWMEQKRRQQSCVNLMSSIRYFRHYNNCRTKQTTCNENGAKFISFASSSIYTCN